MTKIVDHNKFRLSTSLNALNIGDRQKVFKIRKRIVSDV